jgi:hypothetical protein
MKKYILYIVALVSIVAVSCQKEYKEIGDIPSKVDGITASWILKSCSVVDKGGFVEETMDITPFFAKSPKLPNILMTMESGQGFYACDTSNTAFNFFGGISGLWRFDNADFPTKVIFTPTGSNSSIEMALVATIRPTDTYLQLDNSVACGGSEKSVYRLSFIRN